MFWSYSAFICLSYRPQWVHRAKLAESGRWQLRLRAKANMQEKTTMFLQNNGTFFLFSHMKTKHSCIYYPYYLETKWPVLFLFCIVSFSWISLVLYGCPHTFVHKSITKFPFQVYTILKILCSLLIFLIQQGFIFSRREIWVSCSVLLLVFLWAFC